MKNNIRVERAILNITQAELAEKVRVSSTVLALKIARVFEKKVEDVFQLEEED
jgi:putative transcriptional regulator